MDWQQVVDLVYDTAQQTGLLHLGWKPPIMWAVGCLFIYLAIAKGFEPLLLLPIGFGIFLVNFPLTPLMGFNEQGHRELLNIFYHYGLEWEVIPCVIFLGLGAMTDFGPVLSNPKSLIVGAGAQIGVMITFIGGTLIGLSPREAASIGIIGGADGPTTIYLTQKLAPHMLGANALAAYSYMALVPVIQPPIMRWLTKPAERLIVMKEGREVSRLERILFPLIATAVIALLVPSVMPLMGMLMLGNLMRESGVVNRLSDTAENALMNIVTIFLGVSVGATMQAEKFLTPKPLMVLALGVGAFYVCTAGGILTVKLMNLFTKPGNRMNPLIGSAGVSAVPMAARVSQKIGQEYDPQNFLLMHALGPNLAGVIGTAAAAGMYIAMFE